MMSLKKRFAWGAACVWSAACFIGLGSGPARAAAIYDLTMFTGNAGTLGAVDDASVQVNIGFNVSFFGVTTTQLFVNNNGNVSFSSPLADFVPTPDNDLRTVSGMAPGTSTVVPTPVIAPFFADVDTLGPGSGFAHYGNAMLDGRNVFAVTWSAVGYFQENVDRRNSFQLVLIDRNDVSPGSFDFVFNYDTIQWEIGTGAQSGVCYAPPPPGSTTVLCPPASVGWGNGTGAGHLLPGSRVNGAFLDGGPSSLVGHSLNSLVAGRYYFSVRGGVVQGQPGGSGVVPEPASWLLTGAALAAAAAASRRIQRAAARR
jgi:Nidogen-like